jgi:hypothetical protein
MNHLGLVGKIEELTGKAIPILNCPKCSSFWFSLFLLLGESEEIMGEFPMLLAISFLASYSAMWLELLEGYIDTLYLKLYGKITANNNNDTLAADPECGDSDSTVSELQ